MHVFVSAKTGDSQEPLYAAKVEYEKPPLALRVAKNAEGRLEFCGWDSGVSWERIRMFTVTVSPIVVTIWVTVLGQDTKEHFLPGIPEVDGMVSLQLSLASPPNVRLTHIQVAKDVTMLNQNIPFDWAAASEFEVALRKKDF